MKLLILLIVLCASASCGKDYEGDDSKHKVETYANYPEFSWDKVPVCQHLNRVDNHFSTEEAQAIAKSSIVCIEIQQARRLYDAYLLENTSKAAQQIKQYNPNTKILFYWHSQKDLGRYYQGVDGSTGSGAQFIVDATNTNTSWILHDAAGNRCPLGEEDKAMPEYLFDISNPQVSTWWCSYALRAINEPGIDGVFADGIGNYYGNDKIKTYGADKAYDLWHSMVESLDKIRHYDGDNKLLIANGYANTNSWNGDISTHIDGGMIEHFSRTTLSKEIIAQNIAKVQKYAKQNKIVIAKGWPRFTFVEYQDKNSEYYQHGGKYTQSDFEQMCYDDIEFSLACFLVAAGKYSYFHYSWGYDTTSGNLLPYPEFDMALGEPLGDAVRDGYIYTREFENLKVWVDIDKKIAEITPISID